MGEEAADLASGVTATADEEGGDDMVGWDGEGGWERLLLLQVL